MGRVADAVDTDTTGAILRLGARGQAATIPVRHQAIMAGRPVGDMEGSRDRRVRAASTIAEQRSQDREF